MSKLSEELATHRHIKGGLYRVLLTDVHDANNGADYDRKSVIYQSIETGEISMRYEDEFFEEITHPTKPEDFPEGSKYRRFFPLIWQGDFSRAVSKLPSKKKTRVENRK